MGMAVTRLSLLPGQSCNLPAVPGQSGASYLKQNTGAPVPTPPSAGATPNQTPHQTGVQVGLANILKSWQSLGRPARAGDLAKGAKWGVSQGQDIWEIQISGVHHAGYLHKLPNGKWQAYDYHHQPVGGTYSVEYDARIQLANYLNKNQGNMPTTGNAFVVVPSTPAGVPVPPPATPIPPKPAPVPTPPAPKPQPMTVAPQPAPQGYTALQSGMHVSTRPRTNASGQRTWRIRHPMGGGIGEVIEVSAGQYVAITRTGQRVSISTNPSLEIAAQALENYLNLPKVAVPPPVVVPPVAPAPSTPVPPAPMPPSNAKTSLPVAAKSSDLVWAKQTADAWTITHPQLGVLAVAVKVPGGYQIAIGPGLASHPFYGQDAGILAAMKANTIVKWDTSAKSHVFGLLKAANAKAGTLLPGPSAATKKVSVPALKAPPKGKAPAIKKVEEREVIVNGYKRTAVITPEGVSLKPLAVRDAIDLLVKSDPKGLLEALRTGAINRLGSSETDPLMDYLLNKLAQDGLPTVLPYDDFWAGLKPSDVVMFRGDTQQSYALDLRYGKAFWGKGVYGNGTYAATGTLAKMKTKGMVRQLRGMLQTAYHYAQQSYKRKKVFPTISALRWLRGYKPNVIQNSQIRVARATVQAAITERLGKTVLDLIGNESFNLTGADVVRQEVLKSVQWRLKELIRTADAELSWTLDPDYKATPEYIADIRERHRILKELIGEAFYQDPSTLTLKKALDIFRKAEQVVADAPPTRFSTEQTNEVRVNSSILNLRTTLGDGLLSKLRFSNNEVASALGTGAMNRNKIRAADIDKFPPELGEILNLVEMANLGSDSNEWGAVAALAGYDAINVSRQEFIVVLNRNALTYSEGNYYDANEQQAISNGHSWGIIKLDAIRFSGSARRVWETLYKNYGSKLGYQVEPPTIAELKKNEWSDLNRFDSELASERTQFGGSMGRWAQQTIPGDREE